MEISEQSQVLEWLLVITPITLAMVTGLLGIKLLASPQKIPNASQNSEFGKTSGSLHRVTPVILLLSTIAWLGLAIKFDERLGAGNLLATLPPTAAGDPAQTLLEPRSTGKSELVKGAIDGEALAMLPQSERLQQIKVYLSRMVMSSPEFKSSDRIIRITLSEDNYSGTIRYLTEEYPGLLSLMFQRNIKGEHQTVLYYPSLAGEYIYYTPLSGLPSSALSSLSN